MGPEKWKGEVPARGAAEQEEREREKQASAEEETDAREDEGWSQPESSAQKVAPPQPGIPGAGRGDPSER